MYSLASGYRVPALQRGLSPLEGLITKTNTIVGGLLLTSTMIAPPPAWGVGAVAATAGLINVAPGPRSVARWGTVGYRYLRERRVPARAIDRPGETRTWRLHPDHGVMQDAASRADWHRAFGDMLTQMGSKGRTSGIAVHATHEATVREYTAHTQTISVHVPKGMVVRPQRVVDALEATLHSLGAVTPLDPDPLPAVVERAPTWVELDNGRFASTARVTGWPDETPGDLMPRLLLGGQSDRAFGVLYRPLPARSSRRSAKWQKAATQAFTVDKVKRASELEASSSTQGALVDGDTLVDLDAHFTVWGDSPEDVTETRWQATLDAEQHGITLDWLGGQQHRAYAMTTPHGASTQKGVVL